MKKRIFPFQDVFNEKEKHFLKRFLNWKRRYEGHIGMNRRPSFSRHWPAIFPVFVSKSWPDRNIPRRGGRRYGWHLEIIKERRKNLAADTFPSKKRLVVKLCSTTERDNNAVGIASRPGILSLFWRHKDAHLDCLADEYRSNQSSYFVLPFFFFFTSQLAEHQLQ